MKKQNLKSLQLKKKSISSLENLSAKGGNPYESKLICPKDDSQGAGCNTNATGCQSFFTYCEC